MKTKTMKVIDNKLYMGQYSLDELADKYKTPLFVYDEVEVREKIKRYKEAFKSEKYNCHTTYATKAFLAPYLCHILVENDIHADAVSSGDMYLLKKANYPMENVVLHGNNKSLEELTMALDYNVGLIVVDNKNELIELNRLCIQKQKKVKTLFRVNPGVEAHTHAFIQTAMLDSKFGESIFDDVIINEVINIYKTSEYVLLDGFQAHIGSQITDEGAFEKLVHVMAKFIKDISSIHKIDINTLDLGGGFAIKYLDNDEEINIEEALAKMLKAIEEEFENSEVHIKNLLIEPGRSIIGDAGVTLYRTRRTKHTFAGVNYAFIDGGMADNIRPALYQAKYTLQNASQVDGEKKIYSIAGKCCESGDIIVRNVEITKPKCDDVLVVFSTGAYCYSMSMNYNGLYKPAVIFVNNDKINVAIRREEPEDLVKTCVF